jgi:hypothetical protein
MKTPVTFRCFSRGGLLRILSAQYRPPTETIARGQEVGQQAALWVALPNRTLPQAVAPSVAGLAAPDTTGRAALNVRGALEIETAAPLAA